MEKESREAPTREESYTISLAGPGITVDQSISKEIALGIVGMLIGGAAGLAAGTAPTIPVPTSLGQMPTRPAQAGTIQSLREFMDAANARKYPEKIVTIAQYLIDQRGQDGVTREDVRSQFRVAGESLPRNFARDLRLAVASGWIAEDLRSGSLYVTNKGKDAMARQFSGESKRTAATRRGSRRPRRGNGEKASTETNGNE